MSVTLHFRVHPHAMQNLARAMLDKGVDDPEEREALRAIAYPPPRLCAADEAPAPPAIDGWILDIREPCEAGHGDSEECDLCRGVPIEATS